MTKREARKVAKELLNRERLLRCDPWITNGHWAFALPHLRSEVRLALEERAGELWPGPDMEPVLALVRGAERVGMRLRMEPYEVLLGERRWAAVDRRYLERVLEALRFSGPVLRVTGPSGPVAFVHELGPERREELAALLMPVRIDAEFCDAIFALAERMKP